MSRTNDESSVMHTRAMTRVTASSLLPPMSEMGPSKYPKPGTAGLLRLDTGGRAREAVRAGSASPSPVGKRSRSPLEYGPEPYEEYFSPTRSATSGLNNLQRHHSTKQLISRYETMELSAAPSRASNRRTPASLPKPVDTTRVFYDKKRKSSPIRHSIKNFLSVFTKAKSSNKDDTAWTYTTERTNIISLATPVDPPYNPFTISNTVTKNVATGEIACNTPTALRSGTLLYLSWCSTSPNLPVWISCTATLHREHLLITCPTSHGNPSTRILDLTLCADVRSLALNDISSDEQALLPNREDPGLEFRLFEIQFEGKPKEKLAATSVHDRAAWVSAIWSAILQNQETKEGDADRKQPFSPQVPGSLSITTDLPPANCSVVEPNKWVNNALESDTPSTLRTNLGSSLYSDRSLPPTPVSESTTSARPSSIFPTRIVLHDSPPGRSLLLSGTTSRTASPSHLSPSSAHSRVKSPSVANLDHLSVVKQRLAQIEPDPSRASSPSTYSPALSQKSTRKIQLSPLTPTSESAWTALHDPGDLGRLQSLRTSDDASAASKFPQSPSIRENRSPREFPEGDRLSETKSPSFCSPLGSPLSRYTSHENSAIGRANEISPKDNAPATAAADKREPTIQRNMYNDGDLNGIWGKLDDIWRQVRSHPGDLPVDIMRILEAMQTQLRSDLPQVLAKLQKIDRVREGAPIDHPSPKVVLNNLESSGGVKTAPIDLSDIHAKLDSLLNLHEAIIDLKKRIEITTSPSVQADRDLHSAQALELSAQLDELLNLSKNQEAQRAIQNEQHADSSRYLNELNAWLEIFVNNGASQMQKVASGVQRLHEILGCTSEGAQSLEVSSVGHKNGLVSDIRQLLAENKDRDQRCEILQNAVNHLSDIVEEDIRQNAKAQNPNTINCIVDLINQQHQDQDQMLRNLSTELTNEIRGERLRFVDAMKEATEINVQAHVEQFKKELTREVLVMTQDVGRLHKERQAIEQQIADLFAFYSKQKQKQGGSTTPRGPSYKRQQNVPPPPPLINVRSFSQRRPLPKPLNPWNQ